MWPNLELFVHGGVAYTPYEASFAAILPAATRRLETYNASEGFFAVQDSLDADGLLLMLDHGIFYEFIPVADFNGSVAEINTDHMKLKVLVNIFGRETLVEMDFSQVAKL